MSRSFQTGSSTDNVILLLHLSPTALGAEVVFSFHPEAAPLGFELGFHVVLVEKFFLNSVLCYVIII